MRDGWIDVHHHAYHPALVAELRESGVTHMAPGVPVPRWTPEGSIGVMDRCGIAGAVLSVLLPDAALRDGEGQGLVRRTNTRTAELARDHPGRFAALASLPLPDVRATLAEIDHAFDRLGMGGAVIPASLPDGRLPGDPLLAPVFEELNRRQAVVFLHPNPAVRCECAGYAGPGPRVPPPVVDFVMDTTRCVVDLLYRGVLERNPDIRFVLAHAGGTVPYLLERIELGAVWVAKGNDYARPESVRHHLSRLYYEVAQSAWPGVFDCLRAMTHPHHILFGTDFPFMPESVIERTRDRIRGEKEPGAEEIGRANPLALFPGLV
ncbi:amidohydrolase family protein [Nocardiopsis gilva]|uniref:amidohydrolase family protein n=1 Tax=Nocardiopsis gilva TaxID=280236 RepID=UPI000349AF31|nr:amidohydrolase family protein [Nocardiopsis gilva]